MFTRTLQGRHILLVEDEPLIVMEITNAFEATGAAFTSTTSLHHALVLVEHDGLSAAILDHALTDGDASTLYARLKERGIPFMIYSGYSEIDGVNDDVPHIVKPAPPELLVSTMEALIKRSAG